MMILSLLLLAINPVAAGVDARDSGLTDVHHFSDVSLGVPCYDEGANHTDLLQSELRASVPLSLGLPVSADLISHIVCLGTKQQVSGVAADRVVAGMTNDLTIGDGAIHST